MNTHQCWHELASSLEPDGSGNISPDIFLCVMQKEEPKWFFCVSGNTILRRSVCWLIYCCQPTDLQIHLKCRRSGFCISWFTKSDISSNPPTRLHARLVLSRVYPSDGLQKPRVCLVFTRSVPVIYQKAKANITRTPTNGDDIVKGGAKMLFTWPNPIDWS